MGLSLPLSNTQYLGEVRYSPVCEWIGRGERCSAPTEVGRNYCEGHLWRVYQKGTNIRARIPRYQESVD